MHRETIESELLYSRIAKKYDAVFERSILSEGRVTKLIAGLLDGRRVLDLGCGNGRWLDRFNPDEYTGLDLNEQMLHEARTRYPKSRFVRGDMTTSPFADNSFEGVMSMFGAMGHLAPLGQQHMIDEACRVPTAGWDGDSN